ncbi:hypothetical protein DFQ28_005314 [Apophysomyces sp. BC1034]|nr:hypothetical protein DFQ28_005314 [Apophysomyces sp. BC1034]
MTKLEDDLVWTEYLTKNNIIGNLADVERREGILELLRSLLPAFNRHIAQENNIDRDSFQCSLVPFGSYGLGGHLVDADIDIVFLGPWPVRRSYFYKVFSTQLRRQPAVQDVEVIQRTNVPIIKCTIDTIAVDISFVRLRLDTIPPNIDLLDDDLLRNLDSTCVASMDGPRVHKYVMDHINPKHLQVFRRTLQCVKYWATRRCIYGKPMGYLNGSTWTLLLVKTYMDAMNEPVTIHTLLQLFFEKWSSWHWPTPVIIGDYIPDLGGGSIPYHTLQEFEDAVMPIVSPCYPVCSTAPYVTKSTLRIMTKELDRARNIINAPQMTADEVLQKLFKPFDFVKPYINFLKIITSCDTLRSHETWYAIEFMLYMTYA